MGRHELEMYRHHDHHHDMSNFTESSTSRSGIRSDQWRILFLCQYKKKYIAHNPYFSDRSLVSTFNSQHQSGHQHSDDPENIWSLTNRIHHDGTGKARNPEYSVSMTFFSYQVISDLN